MTFRNLIIVISFLFGFCVPIQAGSDQRNSEDDNRIVSTTTVLALPNELIVKILSFYGDDIHEKNLHDHNLKDLANFRRVNRNWHGAVSDAFRSHNILFYEKPYNYKQRRVVKVPLEKFVNFISSINFNCFTITNIDQMVNDSEKVKSLSELKNIKVLEFRDISTSTSTQFAFLDVNEKSSIFNAILKEVAKLVTLEELNISKFSNWGVVDLSAMTNLKKINLKYTNNLTSNDLEAIGKIPNLEELNLYGSHYSTNSLKLLLSDLKNLQKLIIEYYTYSSSTITETKNTDIELLKKVRASLNLSEVNIVVND